MKYKKPSQRSEWKSSRWCVWCLSVFVLARIKFSSVLIDVLEFHSYYSFYTTPPVFCCIAFVWTLNYCSVVLCYMHSSLYVLWYLFLQLNAWKHPWKLPLLYVHCTLICVIKLQYIVISVDFSVVLVGVIMFSAPETKRNILILDIPVSGISWSKRVSLIHPGTSSFWHVWGSSTSIRMFSHSISILITFSCACPHCSGINQKKNSLYLWERHRLSLAGDKLIDPLFSIVLIDLQLQGVLLRAAEKSSSSSWLLWVDPNTQ